MPALRTRTGTGLYCAYVWTHMKIGFVNQLMICNMFYLIIYFRIYCRNEIIVYKYKTLILNFTPLKLEFNFFSCILFHLYNSINR